MFPETAAIHAGYDTDPVTRALAVPVYQTVSYEFESAEHAAALFNLEVEGHRYGRISNPTVSVLERRVAALEGGQGAVCVASGQAAMYFAMMNLAGPGSNIVSIPQLYGTTHTLLSHILPGLGIAGRFAENGSPQAVAAQIDENTRAIYCESVGNPAGNITDIAGLAEVAHSHRIPLIVDNTVATPILHRPFEHGADIVVHSLTKFLGGHGTTLGGAIVDAGNFPWEAEAERFPMFSQPDASYHGLVYNEHFGRLAYLGRLRSVYLRTIGAALSPMSAFMLLQGIETVAVRIDRHVENAGCVAKFLKSDSRVEWVSFAGLPDSPEYALAQRYFGGRVPSLLTFGVVGGYQAGVRLYNALRLIRRVVNLGDSKSLACHPASTTHRQMSAQEQLKAGVRPETIRLSIGIEHIDDIIADLDQALDKAVPWRDATQPTTVAVIP
ncbi:MAG: O-acetylhomoserine aminocarboxypropyltransferase/cysteine synthase [Rhodospirillales bacterium]|nr:O-acetylhomoserine aminocarboxypropyltransferase/cysteine synthase [Rhodospirillales bacterium]